jgi:hypothetical protein
MASLATAMRSPRTELSKAYDLIVIGIRDLIHAHDDEKHTVDHIMYAIHTKEHIVHADPAVKYILPHEPRMPLNDFVKYSIYEYLFRICLSSPTSTTFSSSVTSADLLSPKRPHRR